MISISKKNVFFFKQYFQLNIEINEDQPVRVPSIRRELLLDYLQYRSEVGKEFDIFGRSMEYDLMGCRRICK